MLNKFVIVLGVLVVICEVEGVWLLVIDIFEGRF